jgi:predicted cation transporter
LATSLVALYLLAYLVAIIDKKTQKIREYGLIFWLIFCVLADTIQNIYMFYLIYQQKKTCVGKKLNSTMRLVGGFLFLILATDYFVLFFTSSAPNDLDRVGNQRIAAIILGKSFTPIHICAMLYLFEKLKSIAAMEKSERYISSTPNLLSN